MEDRHSISEPRPIRETSRAEWEVDILRDDTLVVDTFVINDEVLPPRTGKKGKVLWRLPDTVDKLVSVLESGTYQYVFTKVGFCYANYYTQTKFSRHLQRKIVVVSSTFLRNEKRDASRRRKNVRIATVL